MQDREILLRLRRNLLAEARVKFSQEKAVVELFAIKEELEIEVGKQKSYIAELEDKLRQKRASKKQWVREDLIRQMTDDFKDLSQKYKETKDLMEHWRQKYLNELQKQGGNNDLQDTTDRYW